METMGIPSSMRRDPKKGYTVSSARLHEDMAGLIRSESRGVP